jgi:transposase
LCAALEATPLAYGGKRTTWTLKIILLLILAQVELTPSGLWRLLRRLKRRLKCVALRQRSPDPHYLARRRQLLAARERAAREPEHWAHLDADEASLHRHPSLGWAWAEQQSAPPLAGAGTQDQTRTLFGAVNTWSGQVHFMAAPSGITAHFLEFLRQLLAAYPGRRLSVALDNWGVHASKEAQAFYQRHRDRLEIVWLPTYAPWLMAQEKVWKWMRAFVTHRHPFKTIAEVLQHFWNWVKDLERSPTMVLDRIHKFVPVL